MKNASYGFYKALPGVHFTEAETKVTEALKIEGFGVLTKIDVQEAMKEKLGIEYQRYVILGACNPQLAHRALSTDNTIGLLLPCNVVVAETERGSEIAIIRPKAMFALVETPEVLPVADEAETRLRKVFESL